MTRREIISGMGAMALAGRAVQNAKAATPALSFRIGVATYSLREFQRGLAIKMIKQLNISQVSVKQDFHMPYTLALPDVTKAAGEFTRAGLTITSCGNTDMKSSDPADLKKYFEHAKAAGVKILVTAPLHENLGVIEKLAKEYDIQIAIHTHGPEDKNFPSPKVVLDAVKGMDPRMGLCMDVGHSLRAGADVVQEIANAGPRLLDMHVKDLKDYTSASSQVDVGEGIVPFVAIFRQLQKVGYKGCVNLEYEINSDNPLPGMLRSFGYLHGVASGIAG